MSYKAFVTNQSTVSMGMIFLLIDIPGNKKLHVLTQEPTELRVDVMAWDNEKRYAKYSTFRLGDASSKYTLYVDGYSGDAGKVRR